MCFSYRMFLWLPLFPQKFRRFPFSKSLTGSFYWCFCYVLSKNVEIKSFVRTNTGKTCKTNKSATCTQFAHKFDTVRAGSVLESVSLVELVFFCFSAFFAFWVKICGNLIKYGINWVYSGYAGSCVRIDTL